MRLSLPRLRRSIAAKLYGVAILSLAAVGALASAAVHFASITEHAARELYEEGFVGVEHSARLQLRLEQHRRIVESAPAELDRTRLKESLEALTHLDGQLTHLITEARPNEVGNQNRVELAARVRADLPQMITFGREVIALAENFAQDQSLALAQGDYDRVAKAIEEHIRQYRRKRLEIAERDVANLVSSAASLSRWTFFSTVAALLLIGPFGLWITRGVLSRLAGLTGSMSQLARYDTSVEVPSRGDHDEVGDIARAVEVFKTNAIELLAKKSELTRLARTDALTGLPNRMVFRETLDQGLRFCTPERPTAILYLDLDHFKTINDTLGHPMGDALLQAVALRLKDHAAEARLVSRLGGDEFAIVQVEAGSQNDIRATAAAIVEILSEPYQVQGHELVIATSVGIAVAPRDGDDPDALLKCADLALYKAKAEGRRTFRFFEPEMDSDLRARRALERDLRKAFANEEFKLVYQPIVSLATNRICAFEALLRWHHPEHGFIPPDKFIPVAEEIGLIVPMTEWVLKTACAEARRWPDDIRVAVNLSPVQFRRRHPLQPIIHALAATRLPANRLEVELTESLFLQAENATVEALHQLRAFGVRVAMDDFGTGYSALSYLRNFPFDKIKIDRSFINGLGQHDSEAIVELIAKLGSKLNMSTVAEGVETVEQLNKLRELGCSEAQGYLFSRPVPAADVLEIIANCVVNQAA